ncbi:MULTISPECIES: RidA family protein [unclassified Gilliamella]|uniref:RidA family protein n=1 Tax=unclassified Gilliamella TaxID=2685620 RepID=UPI00080E0F05|nr:MULTISPECIES: RidA family protein [Gilliamella]MCX8583389.1 RidA family protein [Gilliamella sp. B3372]MCX8593806.1 RidA family protein [Gilliamella sp. B3367]MCX8659417.1 RidA family protein [Gilliamella sp. B2772]MCX8662894.1 RidA family protein [Gilliamella sp. B2911]MCX8670023.1 RidA family protein [Gilliamella sp. B2785]
MTITRIDPAERWSEAVIHNNVIYYTSVPTDLSDDAYIQTKSALAEIDHILARANSDKTRILDATLFLVNKNDFSAMNKAWDEWVAKGKAPVRCTVHAGLMKKEYLIEIKIVAAVSP